MKTAIVENSESFISASCYVTFGEHQTGHQQNVHLNTELLLLFATSSLCHGGSTEQMLMLLLFLCLA